MKRTSFLGDNLTDRGSVRSKAEKPSSFPTLYWEKMLGISDLWSYLLPWVSAFMSSEAQGTIENFFLGCR